MLKSLHIQAAIISVMLTATLWAVHGGAKTTASEVTPPIVFSLR